MSTFEEDVDRLRKLMKEMGDLTLEMFKESYASLKKGEEAIYDIMKEKYSRIVDYYQEVETCCLRILVKHQPDEPGMRYVSSIMKIALYLEKICKYAYLINVGSIPLYGDRSINTIDTVSEISQTNIMMIEGIMKSIETGDVRHLYDYADLFYEIESRRDAVLRESVDFIRMDPSRIDNRVHYISITRHLERIGDDICRLTEELIFAQTGERVRIC